MQVLASQPWTFAACAAYGCTVALGTISAVGRRVPPVWHTRSYIVTMVLTIVAALLSMQDQWPRALVLGVALAPLALLPFTAIPVRKHLRSHLLLGLSASPCYLIALFISVPATPVHPLST